MLATLSNTTATISMLMAIAGMTNRKATMTPTSQRFTDGWPSLSMRKGH
jgi:hypothetical protein